ncbi:MAG: hypothetical protein EOP04_08040, partial [Proteobacteria bacterium]
MTIKSFHWKLGRGKTRRVHMLQLFLGYLILSGIVAIAVWPARQVAHRTADEAFVPFRALTVQELVTLRNEMGSKGFDVLKYDENSVLIETTKYVLPPNETSGEAYGSHKNIVSNNWESFTSLHQVDRKELEKGLGFSMSTLTLSESPDSSRVSFDSRRIPFYVAFEILFMATMLLLLTVGLLSISHWYDSFLVLFVWCVVYHVSMRLYAPHTFDADCFYQYLAVEFLAFYVTLAIVILIVPATLIVLGKASRFLALKMIQIRSDTHRMAIERYSFSLPFLISLAILGGFLANHYYQQHTFLNSIQDLIKPSLVHDLHIELERLPPVADSEERAGDKEPQSERINEILNTLSNQLKARMASLPGEERSLTAVIFLPKHLWFRVHMNPTARWFVSPSHRRSYPYEFIIDYQSGHWVRLHGNLDLRTLVVRAFPGLYPNETIFI